MLDTCRLSRLSHSRPSRLIRPILTDVSCVLVNLVDQSWADPVSSASFYDTLYCQQQFPSMCDGEVRPNCSVIQAPYAYADRHCWHTPGSLASIF